MERIQNQEIFNPEKLERGVLERFTEMGPRKAILAATLAAMTGACSTQRVGIESFSGSNQIPLEADTYCDSVDKTLQGIDKGSDTKIYQGPNGTVIVNGIVEDGKVIATVRIMTPDGREQRIDCK